MNHVSIEQQLLGLDWDCDVIYVFIILYIKYILYTSFSNPSSFSTSFLNLSSVDKMRN